MKTEPRAITLVWIAIATLLTSCITPAPTTFERSASIPRGAVFNIGKIQDRSSGSTAAGIDAEQLLRSALENALHEEAIFSEGKPNAYRIDLEILEYEPGDAFKRWLLPGYGATILKVKGSVVDTSSGVVLAHIDHRRGVYWGGAYTIGAWKSIFKSVAHDIAHDLAVRSRRSGFTVSLRPWSDRDISIPAAPERRRYVVMPVEDARSERGRIGERTAAFDVPMGDVFFARNVPSFIHEVITDELRGEGHQILSQDDPLATNAIPVVVTLEKFWTHTETTPLYSYRYRLLTIP